MIRRLKASIDELRERHEKRHQPTGFGFAFADRIDYLDPSRWDFVTAKSSVFLSRKVLRVIEADGPANIAPRYALIFRGSEAIAALSVQIVTVTGDKLQKEDSGRAKFLASKVRQRMLVAGNLLSWGFHGVAFAPGEDPGFIWPAVAEALYRIRRAERLTGQTNFVMVKDTAPQQPGVASLKQFSYRAMETEPNMVLAIDPSWNSYEDYLSALDAKYRRNAKDQLKKLAGAGCTIEPLQDPALHAERLYQLYLSVHENAAIRLVTLPVGYLPALAQAAQNGFRCTAIKRGEEILGFVTTLRDGDTAIAYYIGFDREAANTGLPIYLRLLHATIGDAIALGCTRLSLGRTALEPKAALGAKPEPVEVWIRHRIPALNWALRAALGAVPHAEAPERNPFKQVR